jgi:DNA-binding NtrC family response regulator
MLDRGDAQTLTLYFTVQHFFEKVCADLNPALEAIDGSAMRLLVNYEWPGNVRESEPQRS